METPLLIDIVPEQERYRFVGWEGGEVETHQGYLKVEGPVRLQGVYEKEYQVQVAAPYGVSGNGWYAEGAIATIKVPEKPHGILFLKQTFEGFPGYATLGPTLDVVVTSPLTIATSYRTQVDPINLGVILGALGATLLVYLVTQKARKRSSSGRGVWMCRTRPRS